MPGFILENTWRVTMDECPCVCAVAPPPVELWVRFKASDEDDYGDWTLHEAGDATNVFGFDTQAQFRYTPGDGDAGRWQLLVRFIALDRNELPFVYGTPGDPFPLTDPDGVGILSTEEGADFVQLPTCDENVEQSLVGPAGVAGVGLTGNIQAAAATKLGFPSYNQTVGTAARIFRQETASGGSYPGGENGSAARTYGGAHGYTGTTYASTLSSDLAGQSLQSVRPGEFRTQRTFGVVVESETTRTMTRAYTDDAGAAQTETLTLTLSDEHTTAALEATVQAALDAQLAAELGTVAVLTPPLVVAGHLLTPGETEHARSQAQLLLLPGVNGAYAPPDSTVSVTVRWQRRVYPRRNGGLPLVTAHSQTFDFTVVDASFDDPTGRPLTPPDAFTFSETAADNTRVELTDFACDPNPLLSSGFVLIPAE